VANDETEAKATALVGRRRVAALIIIQHVITGLISGLERDERSSMATTVLDVLKHKGGRSVFTVVPDQIIASVVEQRDYWGVPGWMLGSQSWAVFFICRSLAKCCEAVSAMQS
jgi:hypothetical protein